ncbi:MAG TPA: hypothetical protein VN788_00110 [Verrucomicrobiae bacterium]|nr:hypothetical protein [Verrucomicrobiae bacterium]
MAVNGFRVGQRIWVEVRCGTVQFDFLGTVLYSTEFADHQYHIQFQGGMALRFTREDLKARRVVVRQQIEESSSQGGANAGG